MTKSCVPRGVKKPGEHRILHGGENRCTKGSAPQGKILRTTVSLNSPFGDFFRYSLWVVLGPIIVMSSTYMVTITLCSIRINIHGSKRAVTYPNGIRNPVNIWYHYLGDCLSPYMGLFRRVHWPSPSYPGGNRIYISLLRLPYRKAPLTSIWSGCFQPRLTDSAMRWSWVSQLAIRHRSSMSRWYKLGHPLTASIYWPTARSIRDGLMQSSEFTRESEH